jgi:hypothetical protein
MITGITSTYKSCEAFQTNRASLVDGHIPPTALFALPLAYGHPFLFGFVNVSRGVSLTLLLFAFSLRMTE